MMFSKVLSFFLIFVLSNMLAISQEIVSTYTTDTIVINKYIEKCGDQLYKNPEQASCYCDTILELSQKANYRYGLFSAYNLRGNVYLNNYDLDLAYAEFKKALNYSGINDNPRNKAVALSNIGLVFRYRFEKDSAILCMKEVIAYSKKNNIEDLYAKTMFDLASLHLNSSKYIMAAELLFEAKEKAIVIEDSTLLMFVHNTFGILYTQIGNFNLALYNYNKVIEISKSGQMINLEAAAYTNIGELYFHHKLNYDSAAYFYRLSIKNAPSHNKAIYLLTNNINLGNVFFHTLEFDSAQAYYHDALKNELIEKFPAGETAVLVNLGNYYLSINDLDKATYYLNSGYKLCKELELLKFKKNALNGLYRLDSLKGNYLKSLKKYQEYHSVSYSLQSDLAKSTLASLEFEKHLASQKYNNEMLIKQSNLKSKQISTQRRLIWFSLFGSVLLILFIYIQYLNRKRIKKLHEQLKENHKDVLSVNEELNTSNETLVQQQEQLKELNISKDKFLAILGHDLKSPFVSLLGMLSLLNEDWDEMTDIDKHKTIDRLFISSKNNYQLLEDLLSWGRAQQGQIISENEEFLVYPKIEQLINLFQDQVLNKKINISIEFLLKLRFILIPDYLYKLYRTLLIMPLNSLRLEEISLLN